jgi:hypothetical protein
MHGRTTIKIYNVAERRYGNQMLYEPTLLDEKVLKPKVSF